MSAAELGRKLDVPTNRMTRILIGQRVITADIALRLAVVESYGRADRRHHYFGTSPEFWLNLQSLYELRVAQKKIGKSIKALPRHRERASA
jgi:antitoxin HigA-1